MRKPLPGVLASCHDGRQRRQEPTMSPHSAQSHEDGAPKGTSDEGSVRRQHGNNHGGGTPQKQNLVVRFFKVLGPGLVTGAADDDPSGVATYSQAGAAFGNGLLWTVPLSLPLMMAVQETCDRVTLATGDSLGKLIRRKFSRGVGIVIGVLIVALIAANTLNLAADLNAIGQGAELLHAGRAWIWSTIAGTAILLTVMLGSFELIGRIFKWLCLVLLVYVGVLFATDVDWADVGRGLVGMQFSPTPAYLGLAVGVLGTTISPYMFFWQSAQRVEEIRDDHKDTSDLKGDTRPQARRQLRKSRLDVFTGMIFSVLIMFAIIASSAATLGAHHATVSSAAEAAKALEPIAGSWAGVLFALGFIGSGMLAVPVLAAAGAAGLSALLNRNWGLDRSPRRAPLFYILLGAGMVGGTILAVVSTDPIGLLVLSAIVNGIAAGPFLIIIMLIARDRSIMGRYRNGRLAATLGWFTTGLMTVAGIYGIWYTIAGG
ncbi:Nramp family divalent metal transporter [Microbacterium sp. KUDC0406]|uniref:Nramp family divalent metal transporter n=1 Tax=Microbacterium sp. KUDC0406 TaxID=2909588 RepID=UPI001F159D86|nr:Nramp family divalent metal transporter [Microbacterium sp. KUDC0406]UJP10914.1 Nramp family divalent metal transporter [Microbacterium sp. KUDC0406]